MQLQGSALDERCYKNQLKEQSYLTKTYYKYGKKKSDFEKLIVKTNECKTIILAAKDEYIIQMCEKLNDPITAPKTYWTIINRFLDNKKIPAIPPLLVNGEIISNFSQLSKFSHLFLIHFLRLNVPHYKIQAVYLLFV